MNTNCTKCGAAMPAVPQPPNGSMMTSFRFIMLGYLCDKCGHFNNFRRRKGFSEYRANAEKGGAA